MVCQFWRFFRHPVYDSKEQLPIYLFVVVAGSIFNYSAQMVKEEKLDAYAAVGRNIAHELRTPLSRLAVALESHLDEQALRQRVARELVQMRTLVNDSLTLGVHVAESGCSRGGRMSRWFVCEVVFVTAAF